MSPINEVAQRRSNRPLFSDLFTGTTKKARSTVRQLLSELSIPAGLIITPARFDPHLRDQWMAIARGRRKEWTNPPARAGRDSRLIVPDPSLFWNVHIEVDVTIEKSRLAVIVYHGTSPFLSRPKLATMVNADVARAYYDRRVQFADEFARQVSARKDFLSVLQQTNHWMLIARANYDFGRRPVEEVSAWLSTMISLVSDVITRTIMNLDQGPDDNRSTRVHRPSGGTTPSASDTPPASISEGAIRRHDDGEQLPFPLAV